MNITVVEYRKEWQKRHKIRLRVHKLVWYYKNRKYFYMMRSKATSAEPDEADKWYAEKYPNG